MQMKLGLSVVVGLLACSSLGAIAQEIAVAGKGYSVQSPGFITKLFFKLDVTYDGSNEGLTYAETEMKAAGFNLRDRNNSERTNGIQVNKTYDGPVSEFPFPEEIGDKSSLGTSIKSIAIAAIGVAGYAIGGASGATVGLTNLRDPSDRSAPQISKEELVGSDCPTGKMVKLRGQYFGENNGVAISIAATCDASVTSIDLEKAAMKEILKRMRI